METEAQLSRSYVFFKHGILKGKKPAVVSNCRHVESQHIWPTHFLELFNAGLFTTGAQRSCKPKRTIYVNLTRYAQINVNYFSLQY